MRLPFQRNPQGEPPFLWPWRVCSSPVRRGTTQKAKHVCSAIVIVIHIPIIFAIVFIQQVFNREFKVPRRRKKQRFGQIQLLSTPKGSEHVPGGGLNFDVQLGAVPLGP